MKKSPGAIITLNRRAILLLGVVLSSTVFGVVPWRISAQNNAGDKAGTVALGKSPVNDARQSRAPAGRVAVAPPSGLLYFVNTTLDTVVAGACATGGAGCSLRGAIQVANSHVGDDGIAFDLPAGSVIDLTQALPDLTDSVSISGPGANLVTVRRNSGGNYRIFNVFATGAVTLSGLTMSNGFSSNGGAIANGSGTVNVTNCVLTGNSASSPGDGGGISNYSTGTVNVTNSTISSNTATGNGGGIENRSNGSVNITNSTLSGNTTSGSSKGGGIFNAGMVIVTNSTLSGNSTSSGSGGGISNSGTVNVTNSTLSGNFTNSNSGPGGGIFNSGLVNVTNSTLSGNASPGGGGGIENLGGTANVTNSTLSGNATDGGLGGGIGSDGGTLNVTNSTLSGNTARFGAGGGIANGPTGTASVTNSAIIGNSSTLGTSSGGGISNGGTVQVKNSIIALNTHVLSPDVEGTFISAGFNVIGKTDGSTGFTAPDQTGTIAAPLDPRLDPAGLQDNGGPTRTIALLCGSPAIDKGTSVGLTGTLTTDQRGTGFARTFDDPAIPNATGGNGTDVGPFERQQSCTAAFTDDPLTAGVTPVKVVHITELRARIDAVRTARGLDAYSYRDPTLTAGSTVIKAAQINDLRTALTEAYTAASLPQPVYTDPSLGAGMRIKLVHIAEIRSAVIALE